MQLTIGNFVEIPSTLLIEEIETKIIVACPQSLDYFNTLKRYT